MKQVAEQACKQQQLCMRAAYIRQYYICTGLKGKKDSRLVQPVKKRVF